MFDRLFSFFSHDLGIDLGTANTLVHVRGKGISVREPSIVARHVKSKKIIAIGTEAKKMLGKTPATIDAIKPLEHGVVSDYDAAAYMIGYYIKQVHATGSRFPSLARPRVVIGIPSGITEVERRAVWEAALQAGARECYLIEEPMASAIGAGVSVFEPTGVLIVDIGVTGVQTCALPIFPQSASGGGRVFFFSQTFLFFFLFFCFCPSLYA